MKESVVSMEGYLDKENNDLAKQVRKLVAKGEFNEAKKLSEILTEYLNDNYGHIFTYVIMEVPNIINLEDIIDIVNRGDILEDTGGIYLHVIGKGPLYQELKKMEKNDLHKIGVICVDEGDEEDFLRVLYSLFVDEQGIHIQYQLNPYSNQLLMPGEFYSFLERLGLTLTQAEYLYGISADLSYDTPWMGFPQQFAARPGYWPLTVEERKL